VQIYSGDAAVRLGYRSEQRVVNIVLRRNFHDLVAEGQLGRTTDGGGGAGKLGLGGDKIQPDQRLSLNATYDHADGLLESQRPIDDGLGPLRSLVPASDHAGLSGVYATTIGGVSASLNGSLSESWSDSRLGPRAADVLLAGPPLTRDQTSLSAHVGLALNGKLGAWDWSLIGNLDHNRDRTLTDRDPAIPNPVDGSLRDLARATRNTADADLLFFGPLMKLPAGDLTASLDLSGDQQREEDSDRSLAGDSRAEVAFGHGRLAATVDVPLLGGSGPLAQLGKLSASFGYGRDWYSGSQSLGSSNVTLLWSPLPGLSLAGSRSSRGGAPSIGQLGDPLLTTPNVPVFDFTRGETVDVTRLDGGNPALAPEHDTTTSVWMLLRPIPKSPIVVTANFTDTRSQGVIGSPAVASIAFEQAFPSRFVRDAAGRLVAVDARPVNFAGGDQQQIRWGFNLLQPVGSANRPGSPGEQPRPGVAGGESDGRMRLQLSFFHTWWLVDRQQLSPGGLVLDYLRGDAGPGATGQPRHQLELDANLSRGAIGAQFTGRWQSRALINGQMAGAASEHLTQSPLSVFDLKLFAGGGAQGPPLLRAPVLRGALLTLAIDNVLNSRPRVRDGAGATPIAYQPDYLDPLGRVVRISLRRLF
jgi:hypothetical protein